MATYVATAPVTGSINHSFILISLFFVPLAINLEARKRFARFKLQEQNFKNLTIVSTIKIGIQILTAYYFLDRPSFGAWIPGPGFSKYAWSKGKT